MGSAIVSAEVFFALVTSGASIHICAPAALEWLMHLPVSLPPVDARASSMLHVVNRVVLCLTNAGFLGAGKSTLVRHILTADHGYRIAVILNEFGNDTSIERAIVSDEQVRFASCLHAAWGLDMVMQDCQVHAWSMPRAAVTKHICAGRAKRQSARRNGWSWPTDACAAASRQSS